MGKKITAKAVRAMVDELLNLQVAFERYKELEKLIKDGLKELKFSEVETDRGRVFISVSERVTVSPALAVEILGEAMAGKITVVKRSVSNDIIAAFVKAGEITEGQREMLLAKAEKTPVTNLYVRPLK